MPDEPQDTDWAYAAGFVDGEGCIAVIRSYSERAGRYYYGVQIVVSNRDRDVLDWMQSLWGGWVVKARSTDVRARQAWHWRCPTGLSARPFLTGIRPWLRIKVKQCDNALVMIEVLQRSRRTLGRGVRLPDDWLALQERHYWIQRELNHRGTVVFERRAMHSSRAIHRNRVLGLS